MLKCKVISDKSSETIEVNNGYFRDAVGYLREAEERDMTLSLFDLLEERKGETNQ